MANQNQIVQRPGISDYQAHENLEAEPFQVFAVPFQILEGVGFKELTRLEETVERSPGFKAKQPTQLRLAQIAELEFLQRKRFKRTAGQIAGRAEPSRQIVRDMNRHFHGRQLTTGSGT